MIYYLLIIFTFLTNLKAETAFSTISSETKTPDRITRGRKSWGLDFKLNTGLAKGNTDYFTIQNSVLYFKNFNPLFFYTTGELQYGENDGQKNTNNAMITTRLDYHLVGDLSAILLNTTGHNEFTRVKFKTVTGIGPLYDLKLYHFRNGFSVVLAYNYETFSSSTEIKREAVLAFRDELTIRITQILFFTADYFYVPAIRNFKDYNMRLTSTLETMVWKDYFSTLITVKVLHESMPQPGVKRNDLQLLAGIALKLGK